MIKCIKTYSTSIEYYYKIHPLILDRDIDFGFTTIEIHGGLSVMDCHVVDGGIEAKIK